MSLGIMISRLGLIGILCLISQNNMCDGRGIWGSRRKQSDDEDSNSNLFSGGFEDTRRRASRVVDINNQGTLKTGFNAINSDSLDNLEYLVNIYLEYVEKLMDSPQFDKITPEYMTELFSQIPGFADVPEITEALKSPLLQSPEMMKATIQEGISHLKTNIKLYKSMLQSPETMNMLLQQIPAEYRDIVVSVLNGDMSQLKSMVGKIPGITSAQRKMVFDILDGDMEGVYDSLKDVMSDSDTLEARRQDFIKDPEVAEMFGIPADVVQNKEKWSEFFSNNVKTMESLFQAGNEDGDGTHDEVLKKFASSRFAA